VTEICILGIIPVKPFIRISNIYMKDASVEKVDTSTLITIDVEASAVNVLGPDLAVQRRLVWKLDLIVMPLLGMIYFTHSLDRGALGNARTNNLETDLGLVGIKNHPQLQEVSFVNIFLRRSIFAYFGPLLHPLRTVHNSSNGFGEEVLSCVHDSHFDLSMGDNGCCNSSSDQFRWAVGNKNLLWSG
jgi:hypothetical protein